MTNCPDIDALLVLSATAPDGDATRAHVEGCAACTALVALASFRGDGPRASERPEVCASFEPVMAALVDGSIEAAALGELVAHLGRCAACNDLVARLTLFRGELDDVPEPAPSGSAGAREEERIVEASATMREITQPARRLIVKEDDDAPVPAWKRAVPYAAIISTSALAAAAIMLLFIGPRTAPAERDASGARTAESGEVASAPGGAYVGDAARRMRELELRAREAEERAREAELRAREAEVRLRELEARVTPSARASAKAPEPKPVASNEPEAPRVTPADSNVIPGIGYLTIVCNPYCDDVIDNGRSLGPSPIVHLHSAVGTHAITLKKEGTSKSISVVIVEGQVTAQRVSMTR